MGKRRKCFSARKCLEEWQSLWSLDQSNILESDSKSDSLFDCSNLVSYHKHHVENHVKKSVELWKALDERKVKKTTIGWTTYKIKLPLGFDYLSRLEEPPVHDDGELVVSLDDPTETLSYEAALWKIFNQTKTAKELYRRCGLQSLMSMKENIEMMDTIHCRVSDRHGLPPTKNALATTVYIELWKRNLRDKTAADSNRAVLEFLGDQNLLDVHNAIHELTDDELWTGGRSGIFGIEDTFYFTGEVDYVTPIMNWLNADQSRYSYLGLPLEGIKLKPMESVRLADIEWALNTRYFHIHHGNIETSVFLMDICQTSIKNMQYPIIHDAWTPNYPAVLCEGCESRSATLVTRSNAKETDGAAQICQSCHDQIFGSSDSGSIKLSLFKQQQD